MNSTLKIHKKPKGIFVLVDDDPDELVFMSRALKLIGCDNPIICLHNGAEAYQYLKTCRDEIFIIISDLKMPGMDGLELKRAIEATPELKLKAIPFFFHSNSGTVSEVKTAYTLNIQGYLQKAPTLEGSAETMYKLVSLWVDCVHPREL